MKTILTIAAAVAVAIGANFAFSALTSSAQATIYDQQAVQNLTIQHRGSALLGFTPDAAHHDMQTALAAHESHDWTVHLRAGTTYQIVGACDEDCTDVDLSVLSADGRTIASDYEDDDYPVVTVTPLEDANVTVHMYMATCGHDPCSAAARVLSQ